MMILYLQTMDESVLIREKNGENNNDFQNI